MPLFRSSREKHLWFWAFFVLAAIFATLFIGNPLANYLQNQNVQAFFFVLGLLLVGSTVTVHSVSKKPNKIEISLLLGIIAVYVMFLFRLGAPERSHLIEYSVLAIFIQKALAERELHSKLILAPSILAFIIAFLIGVLDESIQLFLPNRVFDLQDILFNGIAVMMAVGAGELLNWIRRKANKAGIGKKNKEI